MATTAIKLRPATIDDAARLAHLWAVTFPDKFGPVLGKEAEAVLCDWLRLSQRHLQTTTLAQIEDTVAGFIVLETPTSARGDDGRWLWHALQLHYGLLGALRGLLLMLLIDSNYQRSENEIHIEMLGVAPVWRGHGVGWRLIEHTESLAEAQNVNILTLEVVSDNIRAIELYKKAGFVIKSKQRSYALKWITGHPGYYQMIKQIGPLPPADRTITDLSEA
jgi:ribosomal protein S18 acetylase RimI-like enzyme